MTECWFNLHLAKLFSRISNGSCPQPTPSPSTHSSSRTAFMWAPGEMLIGLPFITGFPWQIFTLRRFSPPSLNSCFQNYGHLPSQGHIHLLRKCQYSLINGAQGAQQPVFALQEDETWRLEREEHGVWLGFYVADDLSWVSSLGVNAVSSLPSHREVSQTWAFKVWWWRGRFLFFTAVYHLEFKENKNKEDFLLCLLLSVFL